MGHRLGHSKRNAHSHCWPNGAGKSTLLNRSRESSLPLLVEWIFLVSHSIDSDLQIAYIPQRNEVDWDFPTTVLDVVLPGTYGDLGWFNRPGKLERDLEKVSMQPWTLWKKLACNHLLIVKSVSCLGDNNNVYFSESLGSKCADLHYGRTLCWG